MMRVPIVVICGGFLLFVCSCSRSDPRAELQSYLSGVPDKTRSAKLQMLSGQLDEALGRHRQLLRESRTRLRALNADYDVTESALRHQAAAARAKLRESRTAIIEVFTEMRQSSSPAEWKRIAELQSKLVIDTRSKS